MNDNKLPPKQCCALPCVDTIVHGVDCPTKKHIPGGDYDHTVDDYTAYISGGLSRCGRCHCLL